MILSEDLPIRGDGRGRLSDEMPFPECQYVANDIPIQQAETFGNTYRAGETLEPIGHPAADRISNRLNQIKGRRTALRK